MCRRYRRGKDEVPKLRLYARELCDVRGFDTGSGVLGLMYEPWGFHGAFEQIFADCTDDESYRAEGLTICKLIEGPLARAVADRDGLTFQFRWRSVTSNPFRLEDGTVRDLGGELVEDQRLAVSGTFVDVSCHELYRALVTARDEVLAGRAGI